MNENQANRVIELLESINQKLQPLPAAPEARAKDVYYLWEDYYRTCRMLGFEPEKQKEPKENDQA